MAEKNIYTSILDYMCKNYEYSLYATDLDAKSISLLQRSVASLKIKAGETRNYSIKMALQDFFNAIFQKTFVYEDDDRLRIVKYFDKYVQTEEEDKLIHMLRLELVKYKDEVELLTKENCLYMFDKNSRKRFEIALVSFPNNLIKDIIRNQISIVYDLEEKDIVIFLNEKIFVKKFNIVEKSLTNDSFMLNILDDDRFLEALWKEVKVKLNESFKSSFDFLKYDEKKFYDKYPKKFIFIIKSVVRNSFISLSENDVNSYTNTIFKNYLLKMLEEVANFLFSEVLESELRAIKFLKFYSQSTKILNNKLKLQKAPIMTKEGKVYNYQNIFYLLKQKELFESKITHKKIELKNLQKKVEKSFFILQRSEDEMEKIKKRRFNLLKAIEKVEDEIDFNKSKNDINNLNLGKLEFSKRDLLEEFKQVEIRSRTQINIINNSHNELEKWENKRHQKNILKIELENKYFIIKDEYRVLCEIFAKVLSQEPFELEL